MTIHDVEVAEAAARAAAGVLRDLRARGELTGRALGDAGDAAAQRAIVATLAARPARTTSSSARRPSTTAAGCPPTGSGSSTRSTAPASTARAGTTGRCTSRSGPAAS